MPSMLRPLLNCKQSQIEAGKCMISLQSARQAMTRIFRIMQLIQQGLQEGQRLITSSSAPRLWAETFPWAQVSLRCARTTTESVSAEFP